ESCKAHAMALQQCTSCGRFRYPPRLTCPSCLSEDGRWSQVTGRGQVYVSLVMCNAYGAAWEDSVPYNIALIELDEGIRMWSNVIGCDPDAVHIGDRVEVVYDGVTEALTLPRFRRCSLPDQGR